nr:sigma 54-interacting transcriptional regulator [Oscillibacter sp.]
MDEISEIPPNMQARLLRVIQERQVVRIGDDKVIPVDIRILAASNRDLRTLVQQGAFRADLYYRLSVLELKVPPLSWRREDIPLLAQSLLQNKNKALNTHVTGFAPEALEVLQSLEWPGNIRQLSNFIERLMILSDPPLITGENARALAQNEATKSCLFLGRAISLPWRKRNPI